MGTALRFWATDLPPAGYKPDLGPILTRLLANKDLEWNATRRPAEEPRANGAAQVMNYHIEMSEIIPVGSSTGLIQDKRWLCVWRPATSSRRHQVRTVAALHQRPPENLEDLVGREVTWSDFCMPTDARTFKYSPMRRGTAVAFPHRPSIAFLLLYVTPRASPLHDEQACPTTPVHASCGRVPAARLPKEVGACAPQGGTLVRRVCG